MPQKGENIGKIGELLAAKYLSGKGFQIIQMNYLKSYGEIDIICEKAGIIHFVEVKTVSRRTSFQSDLVDSYRPEDNVHNSKLMRIGRVIQVYIEEKKIKKEWIFDLITIVLDKDSKKAKISMLEDLVV